MKKRLPLLAFPLLLAGCASHAPAPDLVHQWKLFAVDGVSVAAGVDSELTFDGLTKINGRAGCNRFFGPVAVTGSMLVADRLGVTMMACPPALDEIERAVLSTLKQAEIMLHGEHLQLTGAEHKLLYVRAE